MYVSAYDQSHSCNLALIKEGSLKYRVGTDLLNTKWYLPQAVHVPLDLRNAAPEMAVAAVNLNTALTGV